MSPVPAPAPSPARTRRASPRGAVRPNEIVPGREQVVPGREQVAPRRERPALRVVGEARPRARRRRRARLLAVAAVSVAVGSLFALAAFHAMLASGQVRLDRLEADVAEHRARYQALRLEVARLEAPDRIVRVAQERLGMVPPPGVTYLSPSGAIADDMAIAGDTAMATDDPAVDTDVPAPEPDRGAQAPWATVKPYLGGRP